VPSTGSWRETSGKLQQAWSPAGEAHHREPGTATWRYALTMGCGRMARVHPVGPTASCCPHDLLHVPRHADGDRHGPPTPARPEGKRTEK